MWSRNSWIRRNLKPWTSIYVYNTW
jgi:hypothetical protein